MRECRVSLYSVTVINIIIFIALNAVILKWHIQIAIVIYYLGHFANGRFDIIGFDQYSGIVHIPDSNSNCHFNGQTEQLNVTNETVGYFYYLFSSPVFFIGLIHSCMDLNINLRRQHHINTDINLFRLHSNRYMRITLNRSARKSAYVERAF